MTKLFIARHPVGVVVQTCLPDREAAAVGDISLLLIKGDSFGGLSYAQLEKIANTTGCVDSDDMPES